MELAGFTDGLLQTGEVMLPAQLVEIGDDDFDATGKLLETFYLADRVELAGAAPGFDRDASLWAAQYLFNASQLIINRDAGEEEVTKRLGTNYPSRTASAMYSVDLLFRHLPALLELAKGLSPADILVTMIREQLTNWPLSAVGAGVNTDPGKQVMETETLRTLYVDRVISFQDKSKATGPALEHIKAVIGEYPGKFWPGFENE